MSEAAHHHNPLSQFEVHPLMSFDLAGHNLSFTNASLWMVLSVMAVMMLMSLATRKPQLVPGRIQGAMEAVSEMISGMIKEISGSEGLKYQPLIFTLFMFILFCNLLGMIPYSFTPTSHIIVTFALAAVVFVSITLLAIIKHGPVKFAGYFLPEGTPWWMIWLIYPIEVISYLARPVSLSVRLAANMMAGHTLLKVIAGFIFVMGFWGFMPFALTVLLVGFEIGVAMLQAYIFTVLTCVYLHDALHLH